MGGGFKILLQIFPPRWEDWGWCYTKILSPSCDKTFDIPTCPESQLLEWKLNGFLSICHTNSQHRACPFIQERYPYLHRLSYVVQKQCHHLSPLAHRRLLPEPLCHRRRSAVPWVKREKEKFLKASDDKPRVLPYPYCCGLVELEIPHLRILEATSPTHFSTISIHLAL